MAASVAALDREAGREFPGHRPAHSFRSIPAEPSGAPAARAGHRAVPLPGPDRGPHSPGVEGPLPGYGPGLPVVLREPIDPHGPVRPGLLGLSPDRHAELSGVPTERHLSLAVVLGERQ